VRRVVRGVLCGQWLGILEQSSYSQAAARLRTSGDGTASCQCCPRSLPTGTHAAEG
jgi:hypothetical protein